MSTTNLNFLLYRSTLLQSGFGVPNHISPLGSSYLDLSTGTEYINKNGITLWIEKIAADYPFSTIAFTGGTVAGPTNFISPLTATTYYGDGSHLTGIAGSIFTGGTVTGGANFTAGLTATTISATTYQNLPPNYWAISGSNIINTNASGAVITYNSASNGYYYNTAFKTQYINGGALIDGFTIQNGGNAFGQYIYGVWFNVVAGGGLQDNTGTIKFYTPDGNYWLSNKPIYGTIISANTIQTPSFTANSTGITQSNGFTILSNLSTLNAVNDAAAAALGVPLYGLYRNGNVVQIRIV